MKYALQSAMVNGPCRHSKLQTTASCTRAWRLIVQWWLLGRATFEARATKHRGISHDRVLLRHKIKFQWEEGTWVPILFHLTISRRVGDFALVSYRQRCDIIKYCRWKVRKEIITNTWHDYVVVFHKQTMALCMILNVFFFCVIPPNSLTPKSRTLSSEPCTV